MRLIYFIKATEMEKTVSEIKLKKKKKNLHIKLKRNLEDPPDD